MDDESLSTIDTHDEVLLDPKRFVDRNLWIPHGYVVHVSILGVEFTAACIFIAFYRARKECLVCAREFNMFRKKHNCRMCGEVVCGRCSMHKRVDLPVVENKFRICSCCFFTYRHGMPKKNSLTGSSSSFEAGGET
jgi:hypothetical protein